MKSLAVVIFAAGRGTRMRSDLPKVLHPVLGLPMIEYPVRVAKALRPGAIVVVVGNGAAEVTGIVEQYGCRAVVQKRQKGTGDALKVALKALKGFTGTVLVLNGDMPLITVDALKRLLAFHRKQGSLLTMGTFETKHPGSYGRVLRDNLGRVAGVVENKDATDAQRAVGEVNGGVFAMEAQVFPLCSRLKPSPVSGEYYITDLVGAVVSTGGKAGALDLGEEELRGINTRGEMAEAGALLRDRLVRSWMDRGVTFLDPKTVWLHPDVRLGRDTVIHPNVSLEGRCRIAKECTIYPGTRLRNSTVGAGSAILDGTVIEESVVGADSRVGPMAHLRPGSVVGAEARVGNFVELKNTELGKRVKASHLTYLGDARIGEGTNIGAGTITCNYDGREKHRTVVENNVFIGSDSQLVAPVTVGRGAYVGAGTTVTEDVPAGALALSRVAQKTVAGWAIKKRRK